MTADLQIAAPQKALSAEGPRLELSDGQKQARREFRAFVAEHVAPFAGGWDREGAVPREVIDRLRQKGYLGASLPRDLGGGGLDPITYGLLTEEIGRGCSSLRSLLTVHDMVSLALARWGSREVRDTLVPRLARAERLAAFALSEPEVGSDGAGVQTEARQEGEHWVIDGCKKWITFGQIADFFLVIARVPGQEPSGGAGLLPGGRIAAFLVPADAPGLERTAIDTVVGTRASLLAQLVLRDCRVPGSHLVGRVGFGFSHVAGTALDHGRYSVAWGSVGIAEACLEACRDYTARRRQFGKPLDQHPLVQRKLTEMIAETRAARLLCYRAGYLRQTGDVSASMETMLAKYFASRAAVRAANDAVQLHGANGLSHEFPLERYLRDAKVTEIIEGSSQIQQIALAGYPFDEL